MTTGSASTSYTTRGQRGFSALLLAGLLALLLTPLVRADNVVNEVGATIIYYDGTVTIVDYWIVANNGDGQRNCNAADDTPAVVDIVAPSGVIAEPASLAFSACGTEYKQSVTFSTDAVTGTYTVPVDVTDTGVGTYNESPATVTLDLTNASTYGDTDEDGVTDDVDDCPTEDATGSDADEDGCIDTVADSDGDGLTDDVDNCATEDATDYDADQDGCIDDTDGDTFFDNVDNCTAVANANQSDLDGDLIGDACDTDKDGDGVANTADNCAAVANASQSDLDGDGIGTACDNDETAPVIDHVLNPASPNGDNGWYTSNVSLTWTVTEDESPESLEKTGCVDQSITTDQRATTYSCSASSDGGSAGPVDVTVKRDATAPTVGAAQFTGTAGTNGWYTSNVTVTWSCDDATSGADAGSQGVTTEGTTTVTPSCTDAAGNEATGTAVSVKIDKTAPTNLQFSGLAGAPFYFGYVPAATSFTCSAEDALSGFDTCDVTGYSSAVGTHTLTATATDNAGNEATTTTTYQVLAWTVTGFYAPIDKGIHNTVKSGATVPLKFEVFAGSTEVTSTSQVAITIKGITCGSVIGEDPVGDTTTGATSLRYDTTSGQFIYNWQTPKDKAGSCYQVTMTAADGSSTSATFKLK